MEICIIEVLIDAHKAATIDLDHASLCRDTRLEEGHVVKNISVS